MWWWWGEHGNYWLVLVSPLMGSTHTVETTYTVVTLWFWWWATLSYQSVSDLLLSECCMLEMEQWSQWICGEPLQKGVVAVSRYGLRTDPEIVGISSLKMLVLIRLHGVTRKRFWMGSFSFVGWKDEVICSLGSNLIYWHLFGLHKPVNFKL